MSKRLSIKQRYENLVMTNVLIRVLVRFLLVTFCLGLAWVGFTMGRIVTERAYLEIRGNKVYTQGNVVERSFAKGISTVRVTYKTYYTIECMISGYDFAINNLGKPVVVDVIYDRENPNLATCDIPFTQTLFLAFLGVGGVLIGLTGVFILLFREGSDTYWMFLVGRPVSQKAKKV